MRCNARTVARCSAGAVAPTPRAPTGRRAPRRADAPAAQRSATRALRPGVVRAQEVLRAEERERGGPVSRLHQSTIVKFSLRDVDLAHPTEAGGEGLALLRRLAHSETSSAGGDEQAAA